MPNAYDYLATEWQVPRHVAKCRALYIMYGGDCSAAVYEGMEREPTHREREQLHELLHAGAEALTKKEA